MGILNVTPDSFSDGGRLAGSGAAVVRGLQLFRGGRRLGRCRRRVDAAGCPAGGRRRRGAPGRAGDRGAAAQGSRPLSIDTTKATVARAALDAGADIRERRERLRYDPAMAALVAARGIRWC